MTTNQLNELHRMITNKMEELHNLQKQVWELNKQIPHPLFREEQEDERNAFRRASLLEQQEWCKMKNEQLKKFEDKAKAIKLIDAHIRAIKPPFTENPINRKIITQLFDGERNNTQLTVRNLKNNQNRSKAFIRGLCEKKRFFQR